MRFISLRICYVIIIVAFVHLFNYICLKKRFFSKRVSTTVAILTIVNDAESAAYFTLAGESLFCYAVHQGYPLYSIIVKDNPKFHELCPHSETFQRHCLAAYFLDDHEYDHILYVDKAMGVINPERRIEEFIKYDKDLVFYNRIWNPEISAGSYIAKKSKFVTNFLRLWADYELKLPKSFHGYDTAALHATLAGIAGLNISDCQRIWNSAKNYGDVFCFVVCVRSLLETNSKNWTSKIEILAKGSAWVRDAWLAGSKWSISDFFLNGWDKRVEDSGKFGSWSSPLSNEKFEMGLCDGRNYKDNWKYKSKFAVSNEEVERALRKRIDSATADAKKYKDKADSMIKKA